MSKPLSPEVSKDQSVPSRFCRPVLSSQGSALLISLVFVILISIVLVGFVTTAMLERKSTPSHGAKFEAELLNTMAVEVVASRLSLIPSGSTSWWASQPGQIAYGSTGTMTLVDLTSGSASGSGSDASVNLNIPSLTQGTGLIASSTATSMPVSWIYVRENGTQTLTGSGTNPRVVGRYAFWTDDESSRINVNTAASRKKPEDEAFSHPSRIDLGVLPVGSGTFPDAQKIRDARDLRLFGSVAEMAGVGGVPNANISQAINENKESLTHYNHSPDYGLNPFGEPKIVLTTQASRAGGRPYFDILNKDTTSTYVNPGDTANLDPAKIQALFAKLYPYFKKSAIAWGLSIDGNPSSFSSKTFEDQYKAYGVSQIIINLIDYVRSVESSDLVVLPIRGVISGNSFSYGGTNYGAGGVLGNTRRIHIVEMGIWLPNDPAVLSGTNYYYNGKFKARIYLPSTVGGPVNLVPTGTNPFNLHATIYKQTSSTEPDFSYADNVDITAANIDGNTVMQPGEYRTIYRDIKLLVTGSSAPRPVKASIRAAFRKKLGPTNYLSYDLAPGELKSPAGGEIFYTIDSGTSVTSESGITSVSTDDPVIGQARGDWKMTPGANTFSASGTTKTLRNTLGLPTDPPESPGDPQQDGNINETNVLKTNLSTLPPPASGQTGNLLGMVESVGDIGRVHSGGQATNAGVSWRTLRLQPRITPMYNLPDWLLLELFSTPYKAKTPADPADVASLRPSTNTIGGRINLNERAYPFSTAQFDRKTPLRTLLKSIKPILTGTSVDALVENIINHTVATGLPDGSAGLQFGNAQFVSSGLYQFPGEISEIQGLTKKGEEDEALIRSMVAHLTTRGNVFTVYSVGQKLQQLNDGSFKVLAESRTATMLERYEELNSSGVATGTWKIRVVSTKELGL